MKKTTVLLIFLALLLAFSACAAKGGNTDTKTSFITEFSLPEGMDETKIGLYFYNNNFKEFTKEKPAQNTGYYNKNFPTLIYFPGEKTPDFFVGGKYNRTETTLFDNWSLSGKNVAVFYYGEFFNEGGIPLVEKFWGADGQDKMNFYAGEKKDSGLNVSLAEIFAYYYLNTFPENYAGGEVVFAGNDEGAAFALAAADYLYNFKSSVPERLLPARLALLDMPYSEAESTVTVKWKNEKMNSYLPFAASVAENLAINEGLVLEVVESDVSGKIGGIEKPEAYEKILGCSVSLDYIASFLTEEEKAQRTASRDWYLLSMTSTGVSSAHYDYVRKDTGASYAYALSSATLTSYTRALRGTNFKSENVTSFELDVKQRSVVSKADTRIFGYAYVDKDKDGAVDDGRNSKLAGVKVIVSSSNGFYKVVQTDKFGFYEVTIGAEYVSSNSVTFTVNFKQKEGYAFFKAGSEEADGTNTATAKIYNWFEIGQGFTPLDAA